MAKKSTRNSDKPSKTPGGKRVSSTRFIGGKKIEKSGTPVEAPDLPTVSQYDDDETWVDLANAGDGDTATFAFVEVTSRYDESSLLIFTHWGFTATEIPSGKIITGIKVEVTTDAVVQFGGTAPVTDCQNSGLWLTKSGDQNTPPGMVNKASQGSIVSTTVEAGGDGDMWGVSWTRAEILSDDFGVQFRCENVGTKKGLEGRVKSVTVTVWHVDP